MNRWRGLKALVHDAVDYTTRLVGEGHESSARSVMRVVDRIEPIAESGRAVNAVRRTATHGVLQSIRVVNRVVERVSDVGIDAVERLDDVRTGRSHKEASGELLLPMRSDRLGGLDWLGDAAIGFLNGAVGNHLDVRSNDLRVGMRVRYQDRYLPQAGDALAKELPGAGRRWAIFAHGLGTTEWSWCFGSQEYHGDPSATFGSMLARDLGYTPFFLRYNTGLHISQNGRVLSERLEAMCQASPEPLDEVLLIGHSMGGLVIRSACHYAQRRGHAWPRLVRRVFCLGSPHEGAPLEKVGHAAAALLAAIDTPGTLIPARLIQGRSAGIKDLRYGSLVDDDWKTQDLDSLTARREIHQVPLVDEVSYYFLSTTLTRNPSHPMGVLLGDLLVRTPSARGGRFLRRGFDLETQTHGGINHFQVQNHPAIYQQILMACRTVEAVAAVDEGSGEDA